MFLNFFVISTHFKEKHLSELFKNIKSTLNNGIKIRDKITMNDFVLNVFTNLRH